MIIPQSSLRVLFASYINFLPSTSYFLPGKSASLRSQIHYGSNSGQNTHFLRLNIFSNEKSCAIMNVASNNAPSLG